MGHSAFPPRLLIEDVITFGTPHDGASNTGFCTFDTQCDDMARNSAFIQYLRYWPVLNADVALADDAA